jgi:Cupin-like domain
MPTLEPTPSPHTADRRTTPDEFHELRHIPPAHRIPRISAKTAAFFFDEFYLQERPVIITGLAREWICYHKWTIDHLKQVIGERTHTFRYEEGRTISLGVADYLDVLAASDHGDAYQRAFPQLPSPTERLPYMRHFGPIGGAFEAEYGIKSLFPDPASFSFSSFLFCGVPATKTNCHYDWSHNFVGMIRGVKHVTLLPPKSEQHMAVSDDLRERMAIGNCDFFEDPADLQLCPGDEGRPMHEHPVFASCPEIYYSPLRDGDVVFFPAYWYHYFHNITGSITVTTQSCRYE